MNQITYTCSLQQAEPQILHQIYFSCQYLLKLILISMPGIDQFCDSTVNFFNNTSGVNIYYYILTDSNKIFFTKTIRGTNRLLVLNQYLFQWYIIFRWMIDDPCLACSLSIQIYHIIQLLKQGTDLTILQLKVALELYSVNFANNIKKN